MYILSLIGSLLSYGSLTYAHTPIQLVLTRIPVGLFKHNEASAFAMISDLYDGHQKTAYVGYVGSALGLGFIVGAAVSGVSMDYDVTLPSHLSTIVFCLTTVLVLVFLPETLKKISPKPKEDHKSFISHWSRILDGNLRFYFLILFGISLASLLFNSNLVALLDVVGVSSKHIGYLISYTGLLTVIAGLLLRMMPSSSGETNMITITLGILMTNVILMTQPNGVVGLLLYFVPYIVSNSLLRSYVMLMLSNKSEKSHVGISLSLANSIESVARAITPLVGGVLLNFIGSTAPLWTASIIYLSLLLFNYYRSKHANQIES